MGVSNKGWVAWDKAPSGCTHLALWPLWLSFRSAEACDLIDRQLPHPGQERKHPAWSEETPAGWNWRENPACSQPLGSVAGGSHKQHQEFNEGSSPQACSKVLSCWPWWVIETISSSPMGLLIKCHSAPKRARPCPPGAPENVHPSSHGM